MVKRITILTVGLMLSVFAAGAENVDTLFSIFRHSFGSEKNVAAQKLIDQFVQEECYDYVISDELKSDRKFSQMLVYLGMANHELNSSGFQKAIDYASMAKDMAHRDSLRWLSSCYEIMSVSYTRLGDYTSALTAAQRDFDIGKKLGDKRIQSSALNTLAAIELSTKHLEEALEFASQAVDIERELNDNQGKALAIRLGIKSEVLLKLKRPAEALACINEALEIDRKAGRIDKVGIRLSQKADVLMYLQEWKECRNTCLQALDIFDRGNQLVDKIITLKQLGACELKLKNYYAAEQHLLEGERLCKKTGFRPLLQLIQDYLYLTYKEQNNLSKALYYLECSSANKDSLSQAEYQKLVSEYKIKYETDQKEKQLAYQERANRNKFVFIIVLLALFALIAIVAIVGYRLASIRKKRNDELAAVNTAKDRLFSIVSHDLKNPVAAQKQVLDFLNTHYDQIDDVTKKEQIAALNQSNNQLGDLLTNVLEWASLESGRLPYRPVRADLSAIVRNSLAMVSAQAQRKKVQIKSSIDINTFVYTDINYVETILRNLLTNAIKYSYEEGIVEIVVEDKGTDWHLSVVDNGVGMTEEQQSRLFLKRYESTLGTAEEKGTGMGLIVCKELANKMNGNLSVHSSPGQGSTFTLTIAKPSKEQIR